MKTVVKQRSRTGPLLKYDKPLTEYMQFRITDEQKAWLVKNSSAQVSQADIIRGLIDKEMQP